MRIDPAVIHIKKSENSRFLKKTISSAGFILWLASYLLPLVSLLKKSPVFTGLF